MMRPLEGILVIAVEQAVAAPYCTSRLADAGARVIKIERPEGDFARGYDNAANGQSSYFVWLNRGKQSVVLDLAEREGRAHLSALIAKADVLVQNLKPGAFERLGFAIERLRVAHPSLICCSISGYGDKGPLAQRKAYDLLIQAETGLTSITGGPQSPGRVGISVVDISTGAMAHAAILEALIARSRSGEGADIRMSMFDAMADWLTVPLLNTEAGHPPKRVGLGHPSISPYGVFTSAEGKEILISIQSDREWRSLCEGVLDAPALADDRRFATNLARVGNRAQTDGLVAKAFAAHGRDALLRMLADADIAFAEVKGMVDLAVHPHLHRARTQTPNGAVAYPAPAAIFDGQRRGIGAVPALGEHTSAVLAEFIGAAAPERRSA
jgi:itaconate CoA-transferase